MTSQFSPLPSDLVQPRAGLGFLRLASSFANEQGDLDDESLDAMFILMEAGVLEETPAADMWPELVRGLSAPSPSRMIVALRQSGALPIVLPEVASLFGVPQIGGNSENVDLGHHLLHSLAEAARCKAPLEVRFALLVMNVGKSDSLREHLPFHYRYIERGRPRIEAICDRIGVPDSCRELALLALAECERVHRVSEIRAGPIAVMLERLGAFEDVECFNHLMMVCLCDYRAYAGQSGTDYPKAALLGRALSACAQLDDALSQEASLAESGDDALRTARAAAIAAALGSERWSGE
jgi:tRNA nucleotidyltransferase (CCA-adding enzyme)